jgi:alpha-galactosidase/6-phospho-beta-glucosidase family protein
MTNEVTKKIEDRLLATHVSNNNEFTDACLTGDAEKIMYILSSEMDKNNLHTKGAKKLYNDILQMTKGQSKVSTNVGTNILMFVWNSRMSGVGLAVC